MHRSGNPAIAPRAGGIPYTKAPSAGGTSDLIAPEFPEGIALRYSGVDQRKQWFSAVGTNDIRLSNKPQTMLSGVPTVLTMSFSHPAPGIPQSDPFGEFAGL